MTKCPFCATLVPDESTVCPNCLRAQPPSGMRTKKEREPFPWGRFLILVSILAAVGAYAFTQYRPARPVSVDPIDMPVQTTVAPPLDVAIADTAAVKIAAGKHLAYSFSGGGRSSCHIEGNVVGLSGGDRTVNLFIVDADGLADLENGRPFRSYFESGILADVALSFNVDGRTPYTLVVSNAHSRAKAKTVRLQRIRATCTD
jgi:hypothetical protein